MCSKFILQSLLQYRPRGKITNQAKARALELLAKSRVNLDDLNLHWHVVAHKLILHTYKLKISTTIAINFLIMPHKVSYLFLVHNSFKNWPATKSSLNINFKNSLGYLLCKFLCVFNNITLCTVCVWISCHNISLSVHLCGIIFQKIDLAKVPETFLCLILPK